jgi:hypothetical protein
MDTLDIFLKKYSYKFTKGYPDMNNEQDILLMESILNELGINLDEVNYLQGSQLKKRDNLDKFLNMFYNQEPFDTDNGTVILSKITIQTDSFDNQDINKKDMLKNKILSGNNRIVTSGKFVETEDPFTGTTGNLHKTSEFGGKKVAVGMDIEEAELSTINKVIEDNGGSIDIKLDNNLYKNITKAVKISGNKQADFELIGDHNLYVQHKDLSSSQQYSGVSRLSDNDEVKDFVEAVRAQSNGELQSKQNYKRKIKGDDLKLLAAYGVGNEFGPDKVELICFGNISLEKIEDGTFTIKSATHFTYPEVPAGDYEPYIYVTFRTGMNQQGIKNARFGFYPEKYYRAAKEI